MKCDICGKEGASEYRTPDGMRDVVYYRCTVCFGLEKPAMQMEQCAAVWLWNVSCDNKTPLAGAALAVGVPYNCSESPADRKAVAKFLRDWADILSE